METCWCSNILAVNYILQWCATVGYCMAGRNLYLTSYNSTEQVLIK